MKVERYCTCGAVLRVEAPRKKKAQLLAVWYAAHAVHGDTDEAGARAVRMGEGRAERASAEST
jgi:hypothetical protein